MHSVPSPVAPRNAGRLSALIDCCLELGCEELPTPREIAREAMYSAGFSVERPSFLTLDGADDGSAVVEIRGEILLEERVTLAMDVLTDVFTVRRDGARLVVALRGAETPTRAPTVPVVVIPARCARCEAELGCILHDNLFAECRDLPRAAAPARSRRIAEVAS